MLIQSVAHLLQAGLSRGNPACQWGARLLGLGLLLNSAKQALTVAEARPFFVRVTFHVRLLSSSWRKLSPGKFLPCGGWLSLF
jgi:hypothetical protein